MAQGQSSVGVRPLRILFPPQATTPSPPAAPLSNDCPPHRGSRHAGFRKGVQGRMPGLAPCPKSQGKPSNLDHRRWLSGGQRARQGQPKSLVGLWGRQRPAQEVVKWGAALTGGQQEGAPHVPGGFPWRR